MKLSDMRAFVSGKIDENALKAMSETPSDYDFEGDEQFMQECMAACLPTLLQMELMDESVETMDEDVKNAFITVQDYMVNNGYMPEAASVPIGNPKINVVRLNKESQISRLKTIISLKMARKDKIKPYQKYKLGQKIKKMNLAIIMQRYGAKADRLARKLWQQTKKGKPAAVVEKTKEARGSKKK